MAGIETILAQSSADQKSDSESASYG